MNLVTRSYGTVHVLELNGRFDAHLAPRVEAWQDRAPSPQVVINLANVTFVDSLALSMLVRGMKRFRQRGGDLRLCSLQQSVHIIFELTRMNRAFQLYENEDQAVHSFDK